MKPSLRVAVAGASGIGQHHAKWYNECGCEVVAFLGSCDASCRATAEDLHQSIGFSGRGLRTSPLLLSEGSEEWQETSHVKEKAPRSGGYRSG